MPCNYKDYPPNWKAEIVPRIRARAGECCEWCGAANYQPHPVTGSKVVLTVAHLDDPDPSNVADSNLAALCQRCHNRHDAPMRARNAAATRETKRLKAQPRLEEL